MRHNHRLTCASSELTLTAAWLGSSTTISPSKPLLFFPDTDTEITNIALDPSSSKPSTSATAIEPVIIKLQYEGVKIEDEEDDDEEDEEKAAKRAAKIHKEVIGDDEDEDDEDDEDGDDTSSSDELEQKEVVICSLVPGQVGPSSPSPCTATL